jgi:hypothetical protein
MTRMKKILSSYTGSKAVKHTGAGDNVDHPSHSEMKKPYQFFMVW